MSACADAAKENGWRHEPVAPAATPATTPAATSAATPAPSPVPERDQGTSGYLGVVVASQAVELEAEVEGQVSRLPAAVGQAVAPGDVMAEIRSPDLDQELVASQAALRSAVAEVDAAQIALAQAKDRVSRLETAPEIFSAEQRAQAKAAVATAEARVQQADAGRVERQAELELQRRRSGLRALRSPIAGRVAAHFVAVGAFVRQGQKILRIVGAEDVLVRFAVPPEQAPLFQPGVELEISSSALPRPLAARVARVAPEVDASSQRVFIEATLTRAGLAEDRAGAAGLQHGLVVRVRALGTPGA